MRKLTKAEHDDFHMIFGLAERGMAYGMDTSAIELSIKHAKRIVNALRKGETLPKINLKIENWGKKQ